MFDIACIAGYTCSRSFTKVVQSFHCCIKHHAVSPHLINDIKEPVKLGANVLCAISLLVLLDI